MTRPCPCQLLCFSSDLRRTVESSVNHGKGSAGAGAGRLEGIVHLHLKMKLYLQKGRCDLKKSSKPGDKVPSKGETTYSGGPGVKDCNSTVTALSCSYVDNSQDLACIFPFIGENPGQKSGGSRHDSCLKTKRGVFWCATKVSQS